MTPVSAGILYRIVEWFLTVLPVDASGRRVFDETLADWRREAERAANGWRRSFVGVRAMFAVARSVAGVSAKEVTLIRHSGVLPRLLLWTSAYVIVVNVIRWQLPGAWPLSTLSRAFGSVPLAAYIFPTAILLDVGLGGRHRRSPALGLSVVAVLIAARPQRARWPGHGRLVCDSVAELLWRLRDALCADACIRRHPPRTNAGYPVWSDDRHRRTPAVPARHPVIIWRGVGALVVRDVLDSCRVDGAVPVRGHARRQGGTP
jgi:hypothetical protein